MTAALKRAVRDALTRRWRLHRRLRPILSGRGVIVALHRVVHRRNSRIGNDDIEITIDHLEMMIDWFARHGYRATSIDQVSDRLQNCQDRERFVCFTIDDGYADTYDTAYPIFKRLGIPITLYVATCFPDKTALLWWYQLEQFLSTHATVSFALDGVSHQYDASSHGLKASAFQSIRDLILESPSRQFKHTLSQIFHEPNQPEVEVATLSWNEVVALSKDPLVTIGAHTVTHRPLSWLSEYDAMDEIAESRRRIAEHIGREVCHFAYPFGGRKFAGPREFALVKRLGFKTGVTTREAVIFSAHRRYVECLPRIPPGRDELEFEVLASGFLPAVRHRLKRVVTV